MTTNRLEAFSDGVMAIIITIMVLGMEAPEGMHWADLKPLLPNALSYLLSFIYVGIYWNNHHHLMNKTRQVNGKILWGNLFLLFCLSFLPLTTGWMGKNNFQGDTVVLYGIILLLSAVAWKILATQIIGVQDNIEVKQAYQKDRKTMLSIGLYALGIVLSFFFPLAGLIFFYVVAILWIIPDIRLEKMKEDI